MSKHALQSKHDCDRCGITFNRKSLKRQNGWLLCNACFDEKVLDRTLNLPLDSARKNSHLITPINTPTIFTINETGFTFIRNSYKARQQDRTNNIIMFVKGLPTVISNIQQICIAPDGTALTIIGTSDIDYVILTAGNGTDLIEDIKIGLNTICTLVYNRKTNLWGLASIDTSRRIA